MAKGKADVTVHIDETLTPDRTTAVCKDIGTLAGVAQVRCAEHQRHLLVVEFDPEAVSSGDILRRVQGSGVHAELVGM